MNTSVSAVFRTIHVGCYFRTDVSFFFYGTTLPTGEKSISHACCQWKYETINLSQAHLECRVLKGIRLKSSSFFRAK